MSVNGQQHESGDSYEEELQDDRAHQVGRHPLVSRLLAYYGM